MAIRMIRRASSSTAEQTPSPVEAQATAPPPRRGRPPKNAVTVSTEDPMAVQAKSKKVKNADRTISPKYMGRTTGLHVAEYQNKLMSANFKAKLTDEQLAQAMRDEFPMAVAYTVDHVAGIRSAWNKGKRPGQEGVVPAKLLPAYDAEGNALVRGKVADKPKRVKVAKS